MRTILAIFLALFLFAHPTATSADAAGKWMDVAANPTLSLREREYAAQQAMMLADKSASIIIAALRGEGSDSGLRRQVAAGVLGELGVESAEAPLLEAAFDKDYFLAEAAAAALAKLYSRRDDESLLALLQQGLPEAGSIGGGARPGEEDWVVRSLDAARNRGRFRGLVMRGMALKYARSEAPMPQALVAWVWEGLLDADADFRLHALHAVARTGDNQAAGKLAAFLYTENNPKLLIAGLRAMAAMRPPEYGEAVERHVAHADPMVSLEALAALDAMGYPGAMFPAAPGARAVAAFVSHPSTPVRRRALEILAAGKNPAAVEYIQAALFDRVAFNRAAAVRALSELGFPGAAGALNPLLRDGHPEVRMEAAVALAQLGVVGVTAAMIDDLSAGSAPFRRAAAEALGRIGDSRAVKPLVAVLGDEDAELACAASDALGLLKAKEAGKSLYGLMTGTDKEWVANAARKALWAIYGDDPGMSEMFWKSWAKRNGFE